VDNPPFSRDRGKGALTLLRSRIISERMVPPRALDWLRQSCGLVGMTMRLRMKKRRTRIIKDKKERGGVGGVGVYCAG